MGSNSTIKLSVVMPCYLEEENLRLILPRLKTVLNGLSISYEIIVVDTVTPMDHTRAVCFEQGVQYINRAPNNSFGSAVRSGISQSQGERVLFMDADGSHTPEFIPTLYSNIHEADVVVASRYVEGGVTENSMALTWMSRMLNLTYSFVLGLKCKDVSNSFKIYKADQLKDVDLYCENFDIVEEIFYKLKVLNPGFRIREIPFCFKERMFGETKRNLVLFVATYIFTLLKLRFSKVRRKAHPVNAAIR